AIDPGEDSKLEEEATKLKVPKNRRGRVSNNKVEIGTSYLGISFQYQGNIESIPEINATEGLEYSIDKIIRLLTQKKTKIAVAASEGELSTQGQQGQPGGLSYLKQSADFFDLVPVKLNEGAKPIPDDAVALLIAGPKQQFTERSKFVIDQFLMKGKSVAFFVDGMILEQPQQMKMPGGQETPRIGRKNDTGLEDLLGSYGFAIHDDYVMEPIKNVVGPVPINGQMQGANYPAFLATDTIAKSSQILEGLPLLILPWSSSVELLKDKQSGLVITELATSSDKSWRQKGFFLFNPELPLKPSDERGPFPLAYAAEGKFKSFYAGKPHPDEKGVMVPPGDKNVSLPPGTEVAIDQAEAPGRLLVIGSSTWVSDQNISLIRYVQSYQVDLMLGLNSLDWLAQDRALSAVRNKAMTQRPIALGSETTPAVLEAVNIGLIPFVFLLLGVARWRLRKMRRAQAKL
ncbi:MAG TPA: Gldg family protein, partial [Polyangia bacterium]|nr:Gldg family protein [Polyangia bacterium]